MMNTLKTRKRIPPILLFIAIVIATGACALTGVQPKETPAVSISDSVQPMATSTPFGESEPKEGIHLESVLSIPETVPLCTPVKLEFKVTNKSDQAVFLLTWYTPLEGILGDIFRVTYEGQELPYLGPMVMRAAPLAEQYVLLEAGEAATGVVDVSTAYDFSTTGTYTVAFKSPRISHVVEDMAKFAQSVDELGPVQIPSQPVKVEIVALEDGEGDCAADAEALPASPDQGNEPGFTLTGVVKEVSPSARIIRLQEEVDGFTIIALTAESAITTASGKALELHQIQQGLTVKAYGRPGENQAFLASSVQVVPPEEKTK